MTFVEVLREPDQASGIRRKSWRMSYLTVLCRSENIIITYMLNGYEQTSLDGISAFSLLAGNDWETIAARDKRIAQKEERIKKLRKGVFVSHENCNIRCVITSKRGDHVLLTPAPYEDDPIDEPSQHCRGQCAQYLASEYLNLLEHVTS